MKFTLRQLELFVALADHSTLSAAAHALTISESGLSHAISDLERAMGETLCLRRRSKGYALTPAGRHVVAEARELLQAAEELDHTLSSRRGELRGPVAVGCFTGLAPVVLPPLVEAMARKHPGVELQLTMGSQDELLDQLANAGLDLALLYDNDLPSWLELQPLYTTEVVAVLAEDHPLAARQAVILDELVAEPLIMLDSTPSTADTHRALRSRDLTPERVMRVPSVELARGLVARGLGYSLLMARPHARHVTEEGLAVVDRALEPRFGVTSTVAARPRGHPATARAEAAVECVAEAFGQAVRGRSDAGSPSRQS